MDLILPIIFAITPTDGSCYRVISSSIPQELFHPCPPFLKEVTKKIGEKHIRKFFVVNQKF